MPLANVQQQTLHGVLIIVFRITVVTLAVRRDILGEIDTRGFRSIRCEELLDTQYIDGGLKSRNPPYEATLFYIDLSNLPEWLNKGLAIAQTG